MDSLFSEEVLKMLAPIFATVLSALLGLFIRNAAKKAVAEKIIDAAIPVAYQVVNEIARRTENKIDDKIALGLKVLAEFASTKGVQVTEAQKTRAALVFQALHAQEKAQK